MLSRVARTVISGVRAMSTATAGGVPVEVHNPGGSLRVVVTKRLPGDRWLQALTSAGCRVEVSTDEDTILSNSKVKKLIGDKCDGVIGQLTEVSRSGGFEDFHTLPMPARLQAQGWLPQLGLARS
jgi:hypothetical protein